MISAELAAALARNGLAWTPHRSDVCRLRDGTTGTVAGLCAAASEPDITALQAAGAVWLPSDEQLRDLIGPHLGRLDTTEAGHRCEIRIEGRAIVFEAAEAGDALGAAVLQLLADGWLPRPAAAPFVVLDAGNDL